MHVPWPTLRDPDSEGLAWGLEVCILRIFRCGSPESCSKGHALEKTVYVVAGLSCSVDLSKDQYSGYTHPVIFCCFPSSVFEGPGG